MVQIDLFGNPPEVFIDIHEVTNKRKETSVTLFIKELERKKIPYQVKKLEVADIVLPNDYAVERKTVKDFCHSLFGSADGRPRLFEQVTNLVEAYEHPILLIEGGLSVRLDPTTKSIFVPINRKLLRPRIWSVIEEQIRINPNQYLGAIRSIEERGVRVIQSFGPEDGAKLLFDLYLESKGLMSEGEKKKRSYAIVRQKPRLKSIRDKQLFFMAGLPKISTINAVKILKKYGTPYNAIMKFQRWSVDIDGIGEKIVEEIKKVLLSEWKEEEENFEKK